MAIDRKNSEGYADSTAYQALTNVERSERETRKAAFRPLVYVCSAYSGDVERNSENARRYSRFAVEAGAIPVAMHLLLPQFMDDEDLYERELAMHFNYVMLGKCDELWVFGSTVTDGMAREIGIARKRRIPIKHFNFRYEEAQEI